MTTTELLTGKYGSKYPLANSIFGKKIPLIEELKKIKSGYYASIINPCREAFQIDKKKYLQLKSSLPALTFCGLFQGGHKKENLISYNNIAIIDVDNISTDRILEIKSWLLLDKYVFACWVSPSGNGLKILFHIDSNVALHKFYFDRILDHLYATYEIEADPTGSDVCRLCFISHDENLIFKESADVFPMQEDEWMIGLIAEAKINSISKITNVAERKLQIFSQSEKILFFKTEGRNKRSHREMAKKILTNLGKTNQSITENYRNWLRVALAIANTFTYDIGKILYLKFCRLDGPLHDEYKSENLLEYCYRRRRVQEINFGTIIYLACQKGFVIDPLKKKIIPSICKS